MHSEIRATALNEIQHMLHAILADSPAGMAEHELLKALALRGLALFDEKQYGDTLGLFQRHFLLFHCLYLLRGRLRAEREADVQIDCLCIQLLPYQHTPSSFPALSDNLADYYLALAHLESTDEGDVLQLLEDFWVRFSGMEHHDEALAVMELQAPVSLLDIKRQYRRLAMQHHPDRGGDPEQFRRLEWAMGVLRAVYP